MLTEVCISECENKECRWNQKNCKVPEAQRTLVFMKTQRRCEGYIQPKPEKKKDGSKTKGKKAAARTGIRKTKRTEKSV